MFLYSLAFHSDIGEELEPSPEPMPVSERCPVTFHIGWN